MECILVRRTCSVLVTLVCSMLASLVLVCCSDSDSDATAGNLANTASSSSVLTGEVSVGFAVTAEDALPSGEATLLLSVQSTEPIESSSFAVVVDFPSGLASSIQSVRKHWWSEDDGGWSLAHYVDGDSLYIITEGCACGGEQSSFGPRGEIAAVVLDAPAMAGAYSLSLRGGRVTPPENDQREFDILLQNDSLRVTPAAVHTTAFPDATDGVHYAHPLSYSHLTEPLTVTLNSGALPSGFSFTNGALLYSGEELGTSGTYSFGITVTDADSTIVSQSCTLEVLAAGPSLTHATLQEDSDQSGDISSGDKLYLYFDESVTIDAMNALSDLSLSEMGDTFGSGATVAVHADWENTVVVTLGSSPVLSMVSGYSDMNTSVQLASGATSIVDLDGNVGVASAAIVQIGRGNAEYSTTWIIGQPIDPIPLAEFTSIDSGFEVLSRDLPDGLSFVNQTISGTLTASVLGTYQDDTVFLPIYFGEDYGSPTVEVFSIHANDPLDYFGPEDNDTDGLPLRTAYATPGGFLALRVRGADSMGSDLEVAVPGWTFATAPGGNHLNAYVYCPEDLLPGDYELHVSQDGLTSHPVTLHVAEVDTDVQEYFDVQWWWYNGEWHINLTGTSLDLLSNFELNSTAVSPDIQAEGQVLFSVAPAVFNPSIGDELHVVADRSGGGTSDFLVSGQSSPAAIRPEPYFNGDIDDIQAQGAAEPAKKKLSDDDQAFKDLVEEFCKALQEVIEETDPLPKPADAENPTADEMKAIKKQEEKQKKN